MSAESTRCQGTTQSGTQCKNAAQAGSSYCRLHQAQAGESKVEVHAQVEGETTGQETSEAGLPAAGGAVNRSARAKLGILLEELNQLAAELQKRQPEYRPPAYSSEELTRLVKQNLARFTPDVGVELISDLRANLAGTSPKDLADPDTWKGLWYILNYTAQSQTASALSYMYERISGLPGITTVADLKANLEGTSPKDFLDQDTWKGMYLVVNYSLQATARDLKRKVWGGEDGASK